MRKYYIRRKKDPDLVLAKSITYKLWLIVDIKKEKYIKYFSDPDSAERYFFINHLSTYDWEIVYKDL